MGFYSSATLIKDAQRHGVKTLPVCLRESAWQCVIAEEEAAPSAGAPPPVRLGFCVVRGLSEAHGRALLAGRPFASLDDLKRARRWTKTSCERSRRSAR